MSVKIYLEDFASKTDLISFVAERVSRYEDKAINFLRDKFRTAAHLLTDAELRLVVQRAYHNARERGIKTERDHLKYLIPVIFWGIHFESDPQYRKPLYRAGWIDADGTQIAGATMPKLLDEIDYHSVLIAPDLASHSLILARLRDLYTQPMPAQPNLHEMMPFLKHVWPAHIRWGDPEQYPSIIHDYVLRGMNLWNDAADIIAYVCLSVRFGYQFETSPVFHWAGKALKNDGGNIANRRTELWEGVNRYFELVLDYGVNDSE